MLTCGQLTVAVYTCGIGVGDGARLVATTTVAHVGVYVGLASIEGIDVTPCETIVTNEPAFSIHADARRVGAGTAVSTCSTVVG